MDQMKKETKMKGDASAISGLPLLTRLKSTKTSILPVSLSSMWKVSVSSSVSIVIFSSISFLPLFTLMAYSDTES